MGPLQTHQIISSIQKRELGATDRIAAATNPIWRELAEEKEFETFFPKTSSDSLPLPTPSILKGKSIGIPSVQLSNSTNSENQRLGTNFSAHQREPSARISSGQAFDSIESIEKKKTIPNKQKKKHVDKKPAKKSLALNSRSEEKSRGRKQKKGISTIIKESVDKSFSAETTTRKRTPTSNETVVSDISKNEAQSAREMEIASSAISVSNPDTVSPKIFPEPQISVDTQTNTNLTSVTKTNTLHAPTSAPQRDLPNAVTPLEKGEIQSIPSSTNLGSPTENLQKESPIAGQLKKIQLDNLAEILQDLPSKQFFSGSFVEESDPLKIKVSENRKNSVGIDLNKTSLSRNFNSVAINSLTTDPLPQGPINSLSRQLNQPKTIQINLTISKLSISLLFVACLAIGLGIFGIFEYKKMRDLKDSHLPDPSSPTIELSTTDDPIPSLKAPTRPKRE